MFDWVRSSIQKRTLSDEVRLKIECLEKQVGFTITHPSLYLKALRHRSKLADGQLDDVESYEQLEFLGDAVLDLAISEILFERYPNENEGFMTKARSKLVKGQTLAKLSKKMDLSSLLEIGDRAKGQGVEFSNSVLADVFEAITGAVYKDKGYKECYKFINSIYNTHLDIDLLVQTQDNYKSSLLEFAQANKLATPTYSVIEEKGPPHNRTFTVGVFLADELVGTGVGSNKKKAEQLAAYKALSDMKKQTTTF